MTEDYVHGGTQKARYEESELFYWNCPLCGKEESDFIKTERGALKIVRCRECELIRINPRLERPHEIYQGKQDVYRDEWRMILANKFPHHRDPNYLHDLKIIESIKPSGNFLDIGTNAGSFLRLARGRGWTLTGIEPSHQLAELARSWWGLDIIEGFIEKLSLPESHYDIVTMTDVFEHLVNPREVLQAVRKVIKPDGLLFIKVPNAKFNLMKMKVRRALHRPSDNDFDAYEHVAHYTDKTLTKILKSEGFAPFKVYVEQPVQIPVWHKVVGHYYQHPSPFWMDWKTLSGRRTLYEMAKAEKLLTGGIGYLAPNIGCLARPLAS